jgi:hypothetical protein
MTGEIIVGFLLLFRVPSCSSRKGQRNYMDIDVEAGKSLRDDGLKFKTESRTKSLGCVDY